jgi:hypothetical protein
MHVKMIQVLKEKEGAGGDPFISRINFDLPFASLRFNSDITQETLQ